jgi:hypothetical protein
MVDGHPHNNRRRRPRARGLQPSLQTKHPMALLLPTKARNPLPVHNRSRTTTSTYHPTRTLLLPLGRTLPERNCKSAFWKQTSSACRPLRLLLHIQAFRVTPERRIPTRNKGLRRQARAPARPGTLRSVLPPPEHLPGQPVLLLHSRAKLNRHKSNSPWPRRSRTWRTIPPLPVTTSSSRR